MGLLEQFLRTIVQVTPHLPARI